MTVVPVVEENAVSREVIGKVKWNLDDLIRFYREPPPPPHSHRTRGVPKMLAPHHLNQDFPLSPRVLVITIGNY